MYGIGVDFMRMFNSNFYRRIAVSLAVLAVFVALVAAQAWSRDFVLELTIMTDRQEEFAQYFDLNDREYRNLRNDPGNEIKAYLVEARKKYADEIGYRKEIYGSENYKMVVISSFRYIVKEKSSGRVLLSK
jgi:hypothetical protein